MFALERTLTADIIPASRTETTLVTVVDQDEVVRLGVVAALRAAEGFTASAALAQADEVIVGRGLILLGARAMSAHEARPAVRSLTAGGATVILHSADERPVPLRSAIAEGASGVALRRDGIAGLLSTMRAVLAGRLAYSSQHAERLCTERDLAARLSARESDVLACLSDGLTHRQAARRLGIDEETVKTHLKSVRAKYMSLGRAVTNVGTLMREARTDGWLV
ncbi:DNA-binding response regulator [Nocardioides baekrokdamisoli]|uniref:DNA-binding response regulator n=1 Tax=Nocardioides baekrokdamisoli TaxID=1804624 RepID=A0A3G9IXP1_9ACTN|nr:LuxR C-terminal-related transcriptional regulator [Nocardioides baekrokdamisoli]BBH17173.1 DNA-binding response regulator [Nocardioides baekrokdamisoli]